MSRPEKKLREAGEIVADLLRLRDELWMQAGGMPISHPGAELAMRINSILYSSHYPMPLLPGNWNYDLEHMPIKPGERFLGLWHFGAPDRDVAQIIWAAEKPFPGSMPALYYLTHDGNEAPHYVSHPHAWAKLPEIKRPGS